MLPRRFGRVQTPCAPGRVIRAIVRRGPAHVSKAAHLHRLRHRGVLVVGQLIDG